MEKRGRASLPVTMGTGKILIIIGVIFILAGLFFLAGGKLTFLGHLPGDIHFSKGNTEFYFPIVSCILVSVIGTIILNIFFRR
jgi:hypothetical protein